MEIEDEENPDIVPGIRIPSSVQQHNQTQQQHDEHKRTSRIEALMLQAPRGRDPDAMPPSNAFESVMGWLYDVTQVFGKGNVLFALKAGVLTSKHSPNP
jgi:hypothetical protein